MKLWRYPASSQTNDSSGDVPLTTDLLKGFLLALLGLLFFTCMDSATKYLTNHYEVPFIIAIRYLVHFTLMVLILAPRNHAALVKIHRTNFVILRALALILSSLCMGFALQRMPLAETTSINFFAPTLVVLFAGYVLNEKITASSWVAIATGFFGVILIARPGGSGDTLGVVFALGAATAGAAYQLLSRFLAKTETAIALVFYTALVGTVIFGIALPWFWKSKELDLIEVSLLLSLGLTGGLGHYFFTLAYRNAPASFLAPVTYIQLILAGLFGWLIFDTVPDKISILGMGIIACSGLPLVLKSHLNSQKM